MFERGYSKSKRFQIELSFRDEEEEERVRRIESERNTRRFHSMNADQTNFLVDQRSNCEFRRGEEKTPSTRLTLMFAGIFRSIGRTTATQAAEEEEEKDPTDDAAENNEKSPRKHRRFSGD